MDNDRPVSYTSTAPNARPREFPQRLTRLVGDSSVRGFARRAGVSDTFLRQCLAGRTEPTRTKLIALAEAGGCSVEWLATGQTPAAGVADPHTPQDTAGRLDRSLLQAILTAVEEVLATREHPLSAERKALLITTLHDDHVNQTARSVSREEILNTLARI